MEPNDVRPAGTYDVVVVGAGNAGLCAALAAREAGARVLVVEKASEDERGGNTAYTGGLFRFPFTSIEDVRPLLGEISETELATIDVGSYTEQDFAADMDRVCEGLSDPMLVTTLVRNARPTMQWMSHQGVRWMLATGRQAFKAPDGRFRFFGNLIVEANGGGKGLSQSLFASAGQAGVEIWYEATASALITNADGSVTGLEVRRPQGRVAVRATSVVLCAGGFQANVEMRARYLGANWDLAKVRGTRHNTGDAIRMALDIGAQPFGHWSSCHAVAWDAMADPTGDLALGDIPQRHSYPVGLIVNREGRRFVDEGADFRNYTYAKYGREILAQPGRIAFQVFDAKTTPLLRDEYRHRSVTKFRADTLAELADGMLIDVDTFVKTVEDFNAGVKDVDFDPSVFDGKSSCPPGQPRKANWAVPIDTPPFEIYPVACGITFTFGGLRVDSSTRVLDGLQKPIPGLFAAGELVGGLFYHNYPGGSGLSAGAVFGKLAGAAAAAAARMDFANRAVAAS